MTCLWTIASVLGRCRKGSALCGINENLVALGQKPLPVPVLALTLSSGWVRRTSYHIGADIWCWRYIDLGDYYPFFAKYDAFIVTAVASLREDSLDWVGGRHQKIYQKNYALILQKLFRRLSEKFVDQCKIDVQLNWTCLSLSVQKYCSSKIIEIASNETV